MLPGMEGAQEFLARVGDDLTKMVDEEKSLAAEEESIRQRRGELRARINKLIHLRDDYQDYLGIHVSAAMDDALLVPGKLAYGPMGTIAEMAYRAIVQHGGEMRMPDILTELTRLGRLNGSHSDYGTTYRALIRDTRVRRAAPGVFRLVVPSDGEAAAEPDDEPDGQS